MEASEALALAAQHHKAGRLAAAEQIYRQVLAGEPENATAWRLLGTVALERNDYESAAACFEQALRLRPNYAEAFNNLGLVFVKRGDLNRAVESFQRATELEPEFSVARVNLGNALKDQYRLDESIASYRAALALRPRDPLALSNLGAALKARGDLDEAVVCYRRATEIDPSFRLGHYNLGLAHRENSQWDEAERCLLRAIELCPDYAAAHHALATLCLLRGDFERGWAEYEWRWNTGQLVRRHSDQNLWNGQALAGRTILLHAEQGFGDTFQFIRYAAIVKQLGATVLFESHRPLVKFLTNAKGIDRLTSQGDELPAFDYQVPLLTLPGIFKTTLDTIPHDVPYLFADAALIEAWRRKLDGIEGFRVGINWQGRPGVGPWQARNLPLELLASLADIPGVRLVSMQKGEAESYVTRSPQSPALSRIRSLGEFDAVHGAFMDTAAVMMNLDLVITSDTSVAHLAGALGVPVWVALPFVPDWRWLLDRRDSPWYPTMRLFRQTSRGDWTGVFEEIRGALKEKIEERQNQRISKG